MSNPFRYRVEFRRTGDWYDNEGMWYQISTWCNKTFGAGNWDYFYNEFAFEHERDFMLFKLKWC